nr:enoyl-CoA hydratase/isomerase family protein [Streptomyces sp. alain-838]
MSDSKRTVDYSRYEMLQVTREDRIVTVTINRPQVRNALNGALHEELGEIFGDLNRDDACDVVILTGAAEAFSAGETSPGCGSSGRTCP